MRMALVGLFAAYSAGCGSDDEAPKDEDPAQHACEHASIAGTSITASLDRASAPVIAVAEEPYTVGLPSGGPSFLEVEGPLTGLLFAGTADVVNALYQADSTTSSLPTVAPNEFCATTIPEHFDLDLPAGPYTLEVGPAAVSSVWLMLTSAAGHAH